MQGGAAIFLVSLLMVGCGRTPAMEEYRAYTSPDGRLKLVVYRTPAKSMAMPGQSGDVPGFVRLYELKTGRILEQKDVALVQLIDPPEWSATNADLKLFADWKLPP